MEIKVLMDTIKDDMYPKKVEKLNKREAVRAILVNELDEIGLIYINGTDMFGKRDHFETPGGGVEENETFIDTLNREILEETGYDIDILGYVGTISIEYNLLNRVDIENYFLCKVKTHHETHLLEYEANLFDTIKWFSFNDVINMYQNYKTENIGTKIHQRDFKAIKEGIKLYNKIKDKDNNGKIYTNN